MCITKRLNFLAIGAKITTKIWTTVTTTVRTLNTQIGIGARGLEANTKERREKNELHGASSPDVGRGIGRRI